MKFCFLALLTLNLIVLAMQWVSQRSKLPPEQYVERAGVKVVALLRELQQSEESRSGGIKGEQCLLLGPMTGKGAATYWHRQFAWAGVASESVIHKLDRAPSYMVYFGPLPDKDQALAKLREFHAEKVDSFIVSSGKYENAISLGVFENNDLAQAREEVLKRQGIEAQIGEIERQKEEYWVYVSTPYVAENKDKIDGVIKANARLPEMRQIFCKSVASKKLLP